MTRSRMAAAASFAHLLGFAKRAEEDDDEKDKARRAEEDGDDDNKDAPKGRKANRAEEDDLEDDEDDKKARQAKGEGDDPDDKDDAKGRKAKRAEDDDDESGAEEEDDKDDPKSIKSAVAKERARCAQIMAHGLKSGNAEQAGVFAFDTNMTAAAAVSALNAAGSVGGRGGNLRDRMAGAQIPNVGAGSDGGGESANLSPVAQKIIAAAARAKPQ